MSKISLEPNDSGAGTFTLAAPNSNTNRTLTLPDESGTIFSDGTGVPGSVVTGQLVSSNMPAGSVIQVVSTPKLDVFSTTSSTLTDVTGLSVTITPVSTSSKIMIFASVSIGSSTADNNILLAVTRGDTEIYKADQSGTFRQRAGGGVHYMHGISQPQGTYSTNIMYLDSPSTTSLTTYKVKAQVNNGTMFINRTGGSTDDGNRASFVSSITVMEIAG